MLFTTPLAGLLEILLPILLAAWFVRRYRSSWKLVGIGALIFVISQVLHIPALSGLTTLFRNGVLPTPPAQWMLAFNAVLLGLMAGLFEETARLVGFHLLKPANRSWRSSVALGIGHGGIESALLVGVTVLATFVAMLIARQNPQAFGPSLSGTLAAQAQAFWASPWYTPLVGVIERVSAITTQIALSVLVMQAVIQHNGWFYLAAVLWHTLVDGLAVATSSLGWNVWMIELLVFVLALVGLGAILFFGKRSGESEPPAPEMTPEPQHEPFIE